MKLTIDDLLRSSIAGYLPESFKKLTGDNFYAFFYWYDDKESRIEEVANIQVVHKILMSIYKKGVTHPSGIAYSLGYFQQPFDTQNALFYQFVKYYARKWSEIDAYAETTVEEFFIQAKEQDLLSLDNKLKKTTYNNIFKVSSRDSVFEALNKFVIADMEVINTTVAICDSLETYFRAKRKSSFYGGCLSKIVTGLRNPNGGLIPETPNKLRYLYVGERSQLVAGSKELEEAKEMLRNKFTPQEIYAKTGWFFNKYDQKWRRKITDEHSVVPNIPYNSIFIKEHSKFLDKQDEVYETIVSQDEEGINNLLKSGWDVYLSDVLTNTDLYKHYPSLYKLPIFFVKHTKPLGARADVFYYNPVGKYIMISGNQENLDLRTTLLHETQHAIQQIEGFATGGNTFLAKIIQAIGGEDIKKYFFTRQKVKSIYLEKSKEGKGFDYNSYIKLYNNFGVYTFLDPATRKPYETKIIRKPPTEEDYYEKTDEYIDILLMAYTSEQVKEMDKVKISTFVGSEMTEKFDEIQTYFKKSSQVKARLVGEGYDEGQIKRIFFDTYEALAGEVEARDVQHAMKVAQELENYFLPLTTEAISDEKVTVIIDDFIDEGAPKRANGAVEKTDDDKYIIHLFESVTIVPFLHELGHIISDIIGSAYVEITVSNNIAQEMIDKLGGIDEVFSHIFIDYIKRQKLNEDINDNIGETEISSTVFDDKLNEIFFSQEQLPNEKEFMDRLVFVTKLFEAVEQL